MSNMLYCCRYDFKIYYKINLYFLSIFYKMKLPMIVIMNKSDIADSDKLIDWKNDYDKFNVYKILNIM